MRVAGGEVSSREESEEEHSGEGLGRGHPEERVVPFLGAFSYLSPSMSGVWIPH